MRTQLQPQLTAQRVRVVRSFTTTQSLFKGKIDDDDDNKLEDEDNKDEGCGSDDSCFGCFDNDDDDDDDDDEWDESSNTTMRGKWIYDARALFALNMENFLRSVGVPASRIQECIDALAAEDMEDPSGIAGSRIGELHDAGLTWGDAARLMNRVPRPPGLDALDDPATVEAITVALVKIGIPGDRAPELATAIVAEGIAAPPPDDGEEKSAAGGSLRELQQLFPSFTAMERLGMFRLEDLLLIRNRKSPKHVSDTTLPEFLEAGCGLTSNSAKRALKALGNHGVQDVDTLLLVHFPDELSVAGISAGARSKIFAGLQAIRPLSNEVQKRLKTQLLPDIARALEASKAEIIRLELSVGAGGSDAAGSATTVIDPVNWQHVDTKLNPAGITIQPGKANMIAVDSITLATARKIIGKTPALRGAGDDVKKAAIMEIAGVFSKVADAKLKKAMGSDDWSCRATVADDASAAGGGGGGNGGGGKAGGKGQEGGRVGIFFDGGNLASYLEHRDLQAAETKAAEAEAADEDQPPGSGAAGGVLAAAAASRRLDLKESLRHNAQAVAGALQDAMPAFRSFVDWGFKRFFEHCLSKAKADADDDDPDHITCVMFREAGFGDDPLALDKSGMQKRDVKLWTKNINGNIAKPPGVKWDRSIPSWLAAFRLWTPDSSQKYLEPVPSTWDVGIVMNHFEKNKFLRDLCDGGDGSGGAADGPSDEMKMGMGFRVRQHVRNIVAHMDPISDADRSEKIQWIVELVELMGASSEAEAGLRSLISGVADNIRPLINDRLEDLDTVLEPVDYSPDIQRLQHAFHPGTRTGVRQRIKQWLSAASHSGQQQANAGGGAAAQESADAGGNSGAAGGLPGPGSVPRAAGGASGCDPPMVSKVYFMAGKHGSGKSVVAAKAVEDAQRVGNLKGDDGDSAAVAAVAAPAPAAAAEASPSDDAALSNNIVASAFCRYGTASRSSPHRIVKSLAYQLALLLPEYRKEIRRMSATTADHLPDTFVDLFDALIFGPLSRLEQRGLLSADDGKRVVLVIDAIDECTANGAEILQRLYDHKQPNVSLLPPSVTLFLTNVGEPEEEKCPVAARPIVDVINCEGEETTADLRSFYLHVLDNDDNMRARVGKLQTQPDDLAKELVERSQGLFLYAQFAADMLRTGDDAMWASKEALLANFPPGLDGIFQQYLNRVVCACASEAVVPGGYGRDLCLAMLSVLVAVRGPLTYEIFRGLVTAGFGAFEDAGGAAAAGAGGGGGPSAVPAAGEIRNAFNRLRNVLEIEKGSRSWNKTDTIRLHSSILRWLVDPNRESPEVGGLDSKLSLLLADRDDLLERGHRVIALSVLKHVAGQGAGARATPMQVQAMLKVVVGGYAESGQLERAIDLVEAACKNAGDGDGDAGGDGASLLRFPSDEIFVLVLQEAVRQDAAGATVRAFEVMSELGGFGPSGRLCQDAITVAVGDEGFGLDGGERLLKAAMADRVAPPVAAYTMLVAAAGRTCSPEMAQKALERMRAAGVQPNTWTYTTLIDAWGKRGELGKATELLQTMREDGA
eukprot:g1990.t1